MTGRTLMGFGVAAIAGPKIRKARGRKYDCGKHGKLTVSQIARLAGTTNKAIYQRIKRGFVCERLCELKYEGRRKIRRPCSNPTILIAVRLANAFPDRVPTTKEIVEVHPMCERNAMRWRQAFAEVRAAK